MFTAVRLAVGTLTVIGVGPLPEIDARTAGRAMLLAPLAVIPLALLTGLVGWTAAYAGLPELVVGLLMVGTLALGTRAMHLDGLADTVDGLGSGWDRARALAVMKQGDVGPMGVVALIVVLTLQATLFGRLLSVPPATGPGSVGAGLVGTGTAALLICVSRAALTLVCRRGVPSARPGGLGAVVAGSVPTPAAVGVWLLIAAGLALIARPWWVGPLAAAVAALVVLTLVRRTRRRFGGVTGDVMGASIELALTALLLIVAVG